MATFKEAIEYAQKNPNSEFAKKLKDGIENGQYLDVARREGVDISSLVKKQAQVSTPAQSQFQQAVQSEPLSPFSETVKGIGTGAVKKVFSQVQNIGKSVLSAFGADTSKLGIAQEKLEPATIAENVGGASATIGEFFLPVGVVGKAKKAIDALHAPTLLKMLGKVGTEVGSTVGVSTLQGQTDDLGTQAGITAGIEAAPGVVGALAKSKLLSPTIKYLTEKVPARFLNSIIRPTDESFNFGKNPGLGVVKEGVVAPTRGSLLVKIAEQKQKVGREIESALDTAQSVKSTISTKYKKEIVDKATGQSKLADYDAIIDPIAAAKKKALEDGEKALYQRLVDLEEGLTSIYTPKGKVLEVSGSRILDSLTPKQLQALKIDIGQSIRWTGQAFDSDINKVKVQIYRNLDEILDKNVPGIDKLNSRYANLLTAEKNLERTDRRMQRLVLAGLRNTGIGTAAGVTASLSGDSPLESILKGSATALGFQAIGSTAVKTTVAQALNKLPAAERIALLRVAPNLRRFLFGIQNEAQESENLDNRQ